ncbi:MAG: hypothetical protein M3069_26510 [Chloroflexota bacterium]|nr:hypothetical protein [Chloroflexota bacterium]
MGQYRSAGRAIDLSSGQHLSGERVFALTEQFVGSGLSVVLDLHLGWPFQWPWLDDLPAQPGCACAADRAPPRAGRTPRAHSAPAQRLRRGRSGARSALRFRCCRSHPLQLAEEAATVDHISNAPTNRRPPPVERYEYDPKLLAVFGFLERLERPDAVDAGCPADEVYATIKHVTTAALGNRRGYP